MPPPPVVANAVAAEKFAEKTALLEELDIAMQRVRWHGSVDLAPFLNGRSRAARLRVARCQDRCRMIKAHDQQTRLRERGGGAT